MTDKLRQLQQERKKQLQGFDVWRQASAEAKEAAMAFLEQDIELSDSLLEIGFGNEASDGSRMPGNLSAAEINREMIRNVKSAVKAAKWDLRVAVGEAEGEKIGRRLMGAWRNILDN